MIVAAAILMDVLALILLSEMEALEDPSMWKFISPIVISFALLGGMGYVAIKIVPRYLEAAMKGFFFFFFFFVFQCFVSCTL